MPFVGFAGLALNVLLIVHAIKTGRPYYWIMVILFLPLAGAVAYILVELLPDLMHSRAGQQAARDLDSAIRPNRKLKQLTKATARSNTVENRFQLAKECLEKDRYAEARDLLEGCLEGIHADDPAILLALAKACFGLQAYDAALAALDDLRTADPNFQSAEGHLLYARSLEGRGDLERALYEFEALAGYASGEEARCRYGLLLKEAGRRDEAREVFAEIVHSVELAEKPYFRAQREWYERARSELGA